MALARAIRAFDDAAARHKAAFARCAALEDSGASIDVIRDFEKGPCRRATGELFGAKDEVEGLIRGSGHKAAIVGGRLYVVVPVDDYEYEEAGLGIPMKDVLILDGGPTP